MANNIPSVFVDTDVCLDLLSARKPFNANAERLFTLADLKQIRIYVSALSFANIDYILRSQYKRDDSRRILAKFKTLVSVLPVGESEIARAIASEFADFEDAIQYYTAVEHKIPVLITRNVRDYRKSEIQVMRPEAFLSGR
ncbi:MAG TPA: PIN domain-containing protein [Saprospiraceae bacterium]|nr:PIN domain-containing protein [Saprospiraceae bacterium]